MIIRVLVNQADEVLIETKHEEEEFKKFTNFVNELRRLGWEKKNTETEFKGTFRNLFIHGDFINRSPNEMLEPVNRLAKRLGYPGIKLVEVRST